MGRELRDEAGNVDEMVDCSEVDRLLPVKLTDKERLALGEDIAAAQMKAEQAELDKKAADEGYKGIIESAYADVSQWTKTLRFGAVERLVACQVVMDYRSGTVRVYRLDTSEEIENRPMTTAERQRGIEFPKEGKKK